MMFLTVFASVALVAAAAYTVVEGVIDMISFAFSHKTAKIDDVKSTDEVTYINWEEAFAN